MVREERQRWVALGMSHVLEAKVIGRRGLLTTAMGGLGLLHAFVRVKHLILQHATTHVKMMAEAQPQAARTIQMRVTRHVLHTEARGRAHIATTSLAWHSIFIEYLAHRKAFVFEDALHRRRYGAAARRDLAFVWSGQEAPLSAAEQSTLSKYAMPVVAGRHVFQLPRSRKRARSIHEMEEREGGYAHRQGFSPSDGRERGKLPRKESEF